MAVLLFKDTAVAVQGITGYQGSFHAEKMIEYGTNVVAGVTPGKGGTKVHGVPVYDSMFEAMQHHHIDASIIFVPVVIPITMRDRQIVLFAIIMVLKTEHVRALGIINNFF